MPLSSEATEPAAPIRPALAEEVVIFGLGLVGGSVARATRRVWQQVRITGVDRRVIIPRSHIEIEVDPKEDRLITLTP